MYSPDGHVVLAVAGTGHWRAVRVRTKCAALFVGTPIAVAYRLRPGLLCRLLGNRLLLLLGNCTFG